LEKELKKCEKELKLEKDKDKKAFFKSQIQMLKKELTKCKEITPLNLSEAPFEIPNTWAWVKLGDICEIVSGTSYSKDDLSDEGIRILRGGNINKNTQNLDLLSNDVIVKEKLLNEEKSIQQGDIVITGTNDISNIAKCAFANAHLKNTQIGAFLRIIRIAKEQNAKYIFYIVASGFYEKYIQSCVSGTVSSLLNIKNEYIENFLIPLPPLCEQQEIVKKLDLLVALANDFAITKENLKRIEKRIEKSLLKLALEGSLSKLYRRSSSTLSAFNEISTYNEAIKEKRKELEKELKKCEKELKLEKDKDKKAFFKSQIQMLKKELTKCKEITPLNLSEAPFEIPNTWAWVKLGDICEIVSGTSYSKDDLSDEGIRILRGGNINKNTQNLDLLSNDVIVKEKLLNEEKSIQQGDIVITGTNDISNIAKCAFANAHLKNTQIGAFLRIIRIAKEQNAKYIFYIVASGFYEKYIQSCVSGTVSSLLNIKNEYIENFLIPLPPLCEQEHIVQILDTLFTLKKGLRVD
ncbi:restriction endonuclease subunit S, partial [Campylobacter felis]|uniref:restriction endonuclease subunit S n=1 Tax=Campylobacter felis TaxID=2974565 RepID=UPI0025674B92